MGKKRFTLSVRTDGILNTNGKDARCAGYPAAWGAECLRGEVYACEAVVVIDGREHYVPCHVGLGFVHGVWFRRRQMDDEWGGGCESIGNEENIERADLSAPAAMAEIGRMAEDIVDCVGARPDLVGHVKWQLDRLMQDALLRAHDSVYSEIEPSLQQESDKAEIDFVPARPDRPAAERQM